MAEKKTVEKRGKYKKVECPYCHKHVGNLQNHMIFSHFAELERDGKAPKELTIKDLVDDPAAVDHPSGYEETELTEGEPEPEPDTPDPPPGSIPFYCEHCHAELRKHEAKCWNCGITLIWDGIK